MSIRSAVADQMTPDAMREAAGFAERQIPRDDIEADNLRTLAEAARRLAGVIEYAESVMRERSDTIARGMRVGTAETFLDIARGETNEREGNEHTG